MTYVAAFYVFEPGAWSTDSFFRYVFLYAADDRDKWGHVSNFSLSGAKQLFGAMVNDYAIPSDAWRPRINVFFCLVLLTASIGRFGTAGDANHRPLYTGLLLWLASFTLFFWWWSPATELRAIIFPPLNILLFCGFNAGAYALINRLRLRDSHRAASIALLCFHCLTLCVIAWVNASFMRSLHYAKRSCTAARRYSPARSCSAVPR